MKKPRTNYDRVINVLYRVLYDDNKLTDKELKLIITTRYGTDIPEIEIYDDYRE